MKAYREQPTIIVIEHDPKEVGEEQKLLGSLLVTAINNYKVKWIHIDVPHPTMLNEKRIVAGMRYAVIGFASEESATGYHNEISQTISVTTTYAKGSPCCGNH